jgi:putative FmdB family regulatory protein
LEQRQAFTDPDLTDCPRCAGHLRKLFNSVGVVFKGSGFYRTDSRATGRGSSASLKPSGEKGADTTSAAAASTASAKSGSAKSSSAESDSAKSGSTESSKTPATAGATT